MAYCTCTAGLSRNCNHVAGLIFQIGAAVLIGVTHSVCTSNLASWNIPNNTKKITPGPIKNFLFKTEKYSGKSLEKDNSDKFKRKLERQIFLTMSKCQAPKLKDRETACQELLERILNDVAKSCFADLITCKKNRDTSTERNPPSVLDFTGSLTDSCDSELDVSDLTKIFAGALLITGEQVKTIYNQTEAKPKTTFCQKERHGRITKSKFNNISDAIT